jgi:uncharacterized protein YecE (DUF72 family)
MTPGETLVGTCSWTDKTLIDSKAFYPPDARSAEARLRHYADRFSIVEVDSTYYALPSRRNAELWVERTPDDFTFNVKAFGYFTQHPIAKSRLPAELKHFTKGERKQNLYPKDLPEQAQTMIWQLFTDALEPLHSAGKLGAVLFQFPHWFRKNRQSCDHLRELAERLPYRAAVEFRGGGWMEEERRESTLSLLEQLEMAYVVVDEPQGTGSSTAPVIASTSPELAVVRMHGRNTDTWEKKGISAAERFRYLYSDDELDEWVAPIKQLAEQSRQVHVLFNNCYADFGVRNAAQMATKLEAGQQVR